MAESGGASRKKNIVKPKLHGELEKEKEKRARPQEFPYRVRPQEERKIFWDVRSKKKEVTVTKRKKERQGLLMMIVLKKRKKTGSKLARTSKGKKRTLISRGKGKGGENRDTTKRFS